MAIVGTMTVMPLVTEICGVVAMDVAVTCATPPLTIVIIPDVLPIVAHAPVSFHVTPLGNVVDVLELDTVRVELPYVTDCWSMTKDGAMTVTLCDGVCTYSYPGVADVAVTFTTPPLVIVNIPVAALIAALAPASTHVAFRGKPAVGLVTVSPGLSYVTDCCLTLRVGAVTAMTWGGEETLVYPAVVDVATTVTFPLCVIARLPVTASIVAAVPLVILHATAAAKVAGLPTTERADEAPYVAAVWLMARVGAVTTMTWGSEETLVYPAVVDVATTVTFPLCVIVRIPLAASIVAAVPLVIFHVTGEGKVAGLLATERADEAPYVAAVWLMVSVGAVTAMTLGSEETLVYPAVVDVATTVTFPLCVIARIPLAGSIVAAVPLVIFHVTVAGKVAGLLATERADEAPYVAAVWLMVSVGAVTAMT
jgi:hypothetical protein